MKNSGTDPVCFAGVRRVFVETIGFVNAGQLTKIH